MIISPHRCMAATARGLSLQTPLHILLIAVPLIIQTALIFFPAYGACYRLHCRHDIAAPAGMIGAANFFELSVVVAITLFGASAPAVLATILGDS